MSKLNLLFFGIVATIASLALFKDINLVWIAADFLLTGRVPVLDTNINFVGMLIIACAVLYISFRVLYNTRIDFYSNAVEKNKKELSLSKDTAGQSLADVLKEETIAEESPESIEEDLEEVVVA